MSVPNPARSPIAEARYQHLTELARAAHVRLYDDAGVDERLKRVLDASEFAYDVLRREPALLGPTLIEFVNDPRHATARCVPPAAVRDDAIAFGDWLRRFRRRESFRLVWRDVIGVDDVAATLAGASELAECAIEAALAFATRDAEARHGVPRNAAGERQQLVVLGMGKLGGRELNFSSDVDLIFAFPEAGQCDGARGLANEDFFARLGQKLIQLLGDITVEGFAFRVDMRLRPFGSTGRLALSFAAMEQYYQRDGRDWERYAFVKARPVAGDRAAGGRLLESLKPFVYRRYLDYAAIDGLREMKALIDAEVARQDLADNLKLGPGGIREVEFMVQLAQLIRGGREPDLRTPSLLDALAALERLGLMRAAAVKRLRAAYVFLRRVENRVQMFADEQTHALPLDADTRARIARGLGYESIEALDAAIADVRAQVAEEFAGTLGPVRSVAPLTSGGNGEAAWRSALEGTESPQLPPEARSDLVAFASGAALRGLEAKTRQRLDRLMPVLIDDAAASANADAALSRLLKLLHAVLGRPSYLALLDDQPVARRRVVDVFARSAFRADRIVAHPLLLDELLDVRSDDGDVDDADAVTREYARHAGAYDDEEQRLNRLHDARQGVAFRLGLRWLAGRLTANEATQQLAALAEQILAIVLGEAIEDTRKQYGTLSATSETAGAARCSKAGTGLASLAECGIAVIGYGSLGGAELGFASDLDVVFVYDGALSNAMTSGGPRSVEGSRYFARIAQRVVHWLTTLTRTGRLYEVDVRLRPDGSKGLLVTSVDAFAEYQRERAWVWEHQAIVRARAIAGDATLIARFGEARRDVLCRERAREELFAEIRSMRERWRTQFDRSTAASFDLKQGSGGLVDIEFLTQALALANACSCEAFVATTRTADLIGAAVECGAISAEEGAALREAHEALLRVALGCTLDAAPRIVPRTDEIERVAGVVRAVCDSGGMSRFM
jgi:glutamate-ammonia-ligase adenylyltransferase